MASDRSVAGLNPSLNVEVSLFIIYLFYFFFCHCLQLQFLPISQLSL